VNSSILLVDDTSGCSPPYNVCCMAAGIIARIFGETAGFPKMSGNGGVGGSLTPEGRQDFVSLRPEDQWLVRQRSIRGGTSGVPHEASGPPRRSIERG
jgi:hypothetical protein